jgi:hypothetical protein
MPCRTDTGRAHTPFRYVVSPYEIAVFSYLDGPGLLACLKRVAHILDRHPGGRAVCYLVDDGSGFPLVVAVCRRSGIDLVLEPERRGKALSVMDAVARCQAPILICVGGDGLPAPDAPSIAAKALGDVGVGGVGGRNIPVNAGESRVARAMALLWRLHDRINQTSPKLGSDIIAVRVSSARDARLGTLDDACLEAALAERNHQIAYQRKLSVRMRVPTHFWEAVSQRRKMAAAYREIEQAGYVVSTRQIGNVIKCLMSIAQQWTLVQHLPLLLFIELTARSLATVDELRGIDHRRWAVASSTRLQVSTEVQSLLEVV